MALDPQVEKLIYWALRAERDTYQQIGAHAARAHYARAVRTLDIAPVSMAEVHEHQLELGDHSLPVRQYAPRPLSWANPQPGLLYFHGGGFTIGSIDTHDRVCRMLAAGAGCQVFSVDYRLAPEHRFPCAVDDAFDSLHWLRSQAASLALDGARIAVGGDSAGGTLAATCALHARDRGIDLALQLLIYPGLSSHQQTDSHARMRSGYLLDADLIQWFFEHYLRDENDRHDWRFAPLEADSVKDVAPVWMALAEYDPLRDEGLAYARRLREADVPVECVEFAGMTHSFFQHGGFVKAVRGAHQAACAALADALNSEPID